MRGLFRFLLDPHAVRAGDQQPRPQLPPPAHAEDWRDKERAMIGLSYNLVSEGASLNRSERVLSRDGEAAEDVAARGLEDMYWKAIAELAERGSRHAAELLMRRPEDGEQLMTGQLSDALGVPVRRWRTWVALVEEARRRSEALHHLAEQLHEALGWGSYWEDHPADPATTARMIEVATEHRAQRDKLEHAMGELALEATPPRDGRFIDPDQYLSQDDLIGAAKQRMADLTTERMDTAVTAQAGLALARAVTTGATDEALASMARAVLESAANQIRKAEAG